MRWRYIFRVISLFICLSARFMKHYTLQISGILGEGVCDTAKVGVNPKTKYIYSQYN